MKLKTPMKALCFVLSFILLLSALPLVAFARDSDKIILSNGKTLSDCKVGDIVEFGVYPQSAVPFGEITAQLNKTVDIGNPKGTMTSYGYYSGTGNCDGNMKPTDFMYYHDVQLGEERYRGVFFTSYRPTFSPTKLPTTNFANYPQYQAKFYYNSLYWFKFEPIQWVVVDPENGILVCKSALDAQPFQSYVLLDNGIYYGDAEKTNLANLYSCSQLRKWLTDDFYNLAFSAKEQAMLDGSKSEGKDYITLLTKQQFTDYGMKNFVANSTEYAKSQGLNGSKQPNYTWLLEDAPDSKGHSAAIWEATTLAAFSTRNVYSTVVCVRPTVCIKDSSSFLLADSCPHDYDTVENPSTCSVAGHTVYTCKLCGYSYKIITQPLKEHTLIPHDGKLASYSEPGYQAYYTCQCCTYTTYQEISALKNTVQLNTDSLKIKENGFIYALPGVTVGELLSQITGEASVSDKTGKALTAGDVLGSGASLLILANGEAVGAIELTVPCDVDGDGRVTASDARLALRKSVGLEGFAPNTGIFQGADTNGNGRVEAADARMILRVSVGLEKIKL